MKLSQMYRTALIATMMLILSCRTRHERIRSGELPAEGPKILCWFTAPGRMDRAGPE